MNPIGLVPWAFWGGVSILILTIPVTIFVAGIRLSRSL